MVKVVIIELVALVAVLSLMVLSSEKVVEHSEVLALLRKYACYQLSLFALDRNGLA